MPRTVRLILTYEIPDEATNAEVRQALSGQSHAGAMAFCHTAWIPLRMTSVPGIEEGTRRYATLDARLVERVIEIGEPE